MVTGIDLIKEQIGLANGQSLSFKRQDIKLSGHSLECRINAEDPEKITPCPGMITKYSGPGGFGVHIDSAMEPNMMVVPFYDSMIAKVIVPQTLPRQLNTPRQFVDTMHQDVYHRVYTSERRGGYSHGLKENTDIHERE